MRRLRIRDLVPAGLRSLLRRASAWPRRGEYAHDGETSFSASARPDYPSEYRFEVTTQQMDMADCTAISTAYRPPGSFGPPPGPEMDTTGGATMPRRLLLMVHELHRRGYERLRAATCLSPSGCYWRLCVTPASNICRTHGALLWDYEGPVARYTTGQGARCFGWADAVDDSPGELATKFLERFADLCESGRGRDGAYVRWYSEMLRATEPAGLIYAYADLEPPGDRLPTLGDSHVASVPLQGRRT